MCENKTKTNGMIKDLCSWNSWGNCFLPLKKKNVSSRSFSVCHFIFVHNHTDEPWPDHSCGSDHLAPWLSQAAPVEFLNWKSQDKPNMLNVNPCFGSIYFQKLRTKESKRCLVRSVVASVNITRLRIPHYLRLPKPGPRYFLGRRQESNSFCSVGRGRMQVDRLER